ncbi:MAG: ATP-dependent Clp protease proteolytic subunit [Acidobacteria bacterium]|nr:ATP-dependent Clp protease proteolytic subunit [Acidobacteriota bacterium]MCA1651022.1 ATP-dependent Clp protease proteolytic subunit [Acidobacteriota bacterium]
MSDINDRLLNELVDAVKDIVRKEQSERLRDVYLIGDIEKDSARAVIERLRELANDGAKPIVLYVNSAGGNVTDGLAIHDTIRHLVTRGVDITIVVQGMAYSMGSVVLQAASPGKRFAFPHSWIMIHEPAKWAGWQSTTAAAQHLDRLKQMQSQIYRILADRSGKPLRQIIRDTKRTDFYLDAARAKEYGLIDEVLAPFDASVRTDQVSDERPPQPTSSPAPERPSERRVEEHAPAAAESANIPSTIPAPEPDRTA